MRTEITGKEVMRHALHLAVSGFKDSGKTTLCKNYCPCSGGGWTWPR